MNILEKISVFASLAFSAGVAVYAEFKNRKVKAQAAAQVSAVQTELVKVTEVQRTQQKQLAHLEVKGKTDVEALREFNSVFGHSDGTTKASPSKGSNSSGGHNPPR